MQNLYSEVTSLDKRTVEQFGLSEEVMMEHAALSCAHTIREKFPPNSSVLIVCGNGNNGADGLALARLLDGMYDVILHLPFGATSPLASLQLKRLESLKIKSEPLPKHVDVIVDALYGSGLSRPLEPNARTLLETLNAMEGFKIACDLPSGLHADGTCENETFKANLTITMGALKRSLFSDAAKEVVGEIIVADLGVHHTHYEIPSYWHLMEESDLRLPHRTKNSNHKGSFGHLAIICGEHVGASVLAASAALRFGSGLVSIISNENLTIPYELMQCHSLRPTTNAVALGMGLGSEFDDDELRRLCDHTHPMVLDADIFIHPLFVTLLKRPNLVLTPHPKEFVQILKICNLADIDTQTLQENRFFYVETFCTAYPHVVLLLKGSNVIIGRHRDFFINPHGTVTLAKAGSGDVLSGLIGSLLAQGYDPLKSTLQGSLAHALASQKFEKNNYSLTPFDLIERITTL
ncbi:MAG: NAD(P)H-hydrate dehydratase [Sulfuricurvum sp.]|uniref:NAD(P)H-hydrate dehydratase n=1 Tax=Sulfuricurvum sp. TaxID=2025608 RepID=UPI00260804FD|nr:NAD(P)H-hydrate dehydratase [Sulfuricurvum sp.]MDD2828688.1 NAD(P)H-hydrate dehydratase [Sulfuricurvum sp.]MDD4949266.1 NAD(P)H-hydrate dehydratase [Sulfuricurvum sp.]